MPKMPRLLARLSGLLLLTTIFACAGAPPKAGLVDGRLRPCPDRPNCLNSETPGRAHVAPLAYTSSGAQAWQNLDKTIADTEGVIVDRQPGYRRALYTSRILRFVDDVEFRLDEAAGVIQVRSASRLGYWDLGVNRRRLERLRRLFSAREAGSGT